MIRQALAAKLVSAVGNLCGSRIRPVFLSQDDTFPAITYRRASAGHDPGISGDDALPAPHFEVTCWDRDYDGAVTLSEAVKAALGDEGNPTPGTPSEWAYTGGSVDVQAVTLTDESDTYADPGDGSGKPIYGVRLTFEIIYED